jgi:hypothetical protein
VDHRVVEGAKLAAFKREFVYDRRGAGTPNNRSGKPGIGGLKMSTSLESIHVELTVVAPFHWSLSITTNTRCDAREWGKGFF